MKRKRQTEDAIRAQRAARAASEGDIADAALRKRTTAIIERKTALRLSAEQSGPLQTALGRLYCGELKFRSWMQVWRYYIQRDYVEPTAHQYGAGYPTDETNDLTDRQNIVVGSADLPAGAQEWCASLRAILRGQPAANGVTYNLTADDRLEVVVTLRHQEDQARAQCIRANAWAKVVENIQGVAAA